jgi:hypothetical protein
MSSTEPNPGCNGTWSSYTIPFDGGEAQRCSGCCAWWLHIGTPPNDIHPTVHGATLKEALANYMQRSQP